MSACSECSNGCGCAAQHQADFDEQKRLEMVIVRRNCRIRQLERLLVDLRIDYMAMDHFGGCAENNHEPCDCGVDEAIGLIDNAIRRAP